MRAHKLQDSFVLIVIRPFFSQHTSVDSGPFLSPVVLTISIGTNEATTKSSSPTFPTSPTSRILRSADPGS